MLRPLQARTLTRILRREVRGMASSASSSTAHAPNPPLDLDPSMQALLRDADMSLLRHKARRVLGSDPNKPPRELEVYPNDPFTDDAYMTAAELDSQELESEEGLGRKSPAAAFGSQQIGAVVLPVELQNTISRLIADSDKPLLREDAKRLFLDETGDSAKWDATYDAKYKSWQQNTRHAERDGTAFASVALPAHYSAIYSVFDHVRQRLGPSWSIQRVIDWGCGTGSGLWATSHSFQKPAHHGPEDGTDPQMSNSTLTSYIGIDKRVGLVAIGKRLIQNANVGNVSVSWQKTFHEEDKSPRNESSDVLALSAFMLSSLPTPVARKQVVKEMWESGANMIVLIDHGSAAGFECVAEAREWLLRWGQSESADPEAQDWPVRGAHVVAPCPHDRACPLFHTGSNQVFCSFSQRLQRPDFVRKTKHAKGGHEDVGYTYAVIRRGSRPKPPGTSVGRIGDVGRREQEKAVEKRTSMMQLPLGGDGESVEHHPVVNSPADPGVPPSEQTTSEASHQDLEESLRSEAYYWPRLIFPPLKRSGHIILDGCTSGGKIMRMTIPRSQGKQPFYDARKSSWGDIFPHDPKNPPQERFQPETSARPVKGQDIGKRSRKAERGDKYNYTKLAEGLKEKRKLIKRENRATREYQEQFGA